MKVYTFLTDGFETVEALAVVDVLRRASVEVVTVSLMDTLSVISAQKIPVNADIMFSVMKDKVSAEDLLFLPGGPGHKNYLEHQDLLEMLSQHFKNDGKLAAICAAPSILGRLHLLEGKKAMCFPGFEEYLFGAEIVGAPERVVTDGNITTSRGMGTSIDLGLELVRILVSEDAAKQLATSTQYA